MLVDERRRCHHLETIVIIYRPAQTIEMPLILCMYRHIAFPPNIARAPPIAP